MTKKYYPIDAYYAFNDDKLYCIVKELDEISGVVRKITKANQKPLISFKTAPYTTKIQFLIPLSETTEQSMPYKHYYSVKKALESVYESKIPRKNKTMEKYPELVSLKREIYDDYKVETQFLQQELFSYDDGYMSVINMAFWDIEILHDDTGFPHAEEAKFPINAISKYNKWNNTIDFYCILDSTRHENPQKLMDEISKTFSENFKTITSFKILLFGKEEDLIIQFLSDIKEIDVLIGWNSLTFDTLYMYTRCEKLGLSKYFTQSFGQMFKTFNVVESKKGMMVDTYYTTKILSIDYIMLVKFFSQTNYPSFSLDFIAGKILKDDGCINAKVKIPNLNKEYFKNLPNFALYNVNDVILNKRIDDKLQFANLLFKFKTMTRGFTASLMSINNILDSYIALKAKENGLACISKIKAGSYYKNKIWYIYRKVNHLTNERLELINKFREENKGFSILVPADEMYDDINETGLLDEVDDIETPPVLLTKLQIPFAWAATKYPGAYVKSPKKGIYLNVVDFDASSMYPTSIYTTNNSADTWIYQMPENIALKYIYEQEDLINYINNNTFKMEVYDVRDDDFKILDGPQTLLFLDKLIKNDIIITETGAIFIPAHIKEGFFRKLISEPISNRQHVKKQMKKLEKELALTADHPDIINLNVTQSVLKIIANSTYGYLGYNKSRLFNIILATTITINCQFMIRYVANECEGIIESIKNK